MAYQFKSPSVAVILEADFEDFAGGDAITIAWTVPAGLVNAGESVFESVVGRVRVTGGTNGTAYEITATATKGADSQTQYFSVFVTNSVSVDVVSVDEFLPFVLSACEGVPEDMARMHIAEACKEFCEKSGIWRYELPALPLAVGVSRFTLPTPADSVVIGVTDLRMSNGHRPCLAAPFQLASMPDTPNGLPQEWAHDETQLMFWPAPATADTVRCTVVLAPTYDAVAVPAFLATQYRRAIAEGAKYQLMAIPNKPWTNPDFAAKSGAEFQAAIDTAKVRSIVGRAPAQMRVAFRRLGG